MEKYYYTYKVTLPETGEFYIGRKTCEILPEKDISYKGTMKKWKVDKELLHKEIIATYPTLKESAKAESELIKQNISNPLNRNAYIPGVGFYCKGHTEESRKKISKFASNMSQEIRDKISASSKGKKMTEEFKKKMSERMKGNKHGLGQKMSEEHKAKLKKIMSSDKNPAKGKPSFMAGKKHQQKSIELIKENTSKGMTDDIKKQLSEMKTGKRFYTNGIKTIMIIPGTQPEGFVAGRKLK